MLWALVLALSQELWFSCNSCLIHLLLVPNSCNLFSGTGRERSSTSSIGKSRNKRKNLHKNNFKLAAFACGGGPDWTWQDNQNRLVWNSSEHDTFQHAWSESKQDTVNCPEAHSPQFEKRPCRSTVALLDKISCFLPPQKCWPGKHWSYTSCTLCQDCQNTGI
jgi:hypothetical protein